jgi:hypothetical protein
MARQPRNGKYSHYIPTKYIRPVNYNDPDPTKVDWHLCERVLLKLEKDLKDAYHKVTDSLSLRYSALDDVSVVRIELVPLNVILEVPMVELKTKGIFLDFKGETKIYLKLDHWHEVSNPTKVDWKTTLRGI